MKRRFFCADLFLSLRIMGHQWWTQITVFNVGGSGDVAALEASTDRGLTWLRFKRNWGTVWTYDGGFLGKSLSFRVKTKLAGETILLLDVVPSSWKLGNSYEANGNFGTPAVPLSGPALPLKTPSTAKKSPSSTKKRNPPPKRKRPASKRKPPPPKKTKKPPPARKPPPCAASRKGSCVTIQSVEPPPPPKKSAHRWHWWRFKGKRRVRRRWVWRRGGRLHA